MLVGLVGVVVIEPVLVIMLATRALLIERFDTEPGIGVDRRGFIPFLTALTR